MIGHDPVIMKQAITHMYINMQEYQISNRDDNNKSCRVNHTQRNFRVRCFARRMCKQENTWLHSSQNLVWEAEPLHQDIEEVCFYVHRKMHDKQKDVLQMHKKFSFTMERTDSEIDDISKQRFHENFLYGVLLQFVILKLL